MDASKSRIEEWSVSLKRSASWPRRKQQAAAACVQNGVSIGRRHPLLAGRNCSQARLRQSNDRSKPWPRLHQAHPVTVRVHSCLMDSRRRSGARRSHRTSPVHIVQSQHQEPTVGTDLSFFLVALLSNRILDSLVGGYYPKF